jgi:predicted NAD-dependent protein-ADP-ribosyltransferase YbiA (DUF1768 family)
MRLDFPPDDSSPRGFHVIAFYEKLLSHGWMPNTTPTPLPLTIDRKQWRSTEHYFQAMKHFRKPPPDITPKETQYMQEMQNYSGPMGKFPEYARRRQREIFDKNPPGNFADWEAWRKDWDARSMDVMRQAVRTKLDDSSLSTQLAEFLSHPDDTVVVEALPARFIPDATDPDRKRDTRWADGGDGSGENLLGIIFTEEFIRRKAMQQGALIAEKDIQAEAKRRSDAFQAYREKKHPGKTVYTAGNINGTVAASNPSSAPLIVTHAKTSASRSEAPILTYGQSPSVLSKSMIRSHSLADRSNLDKARKSTFHTLKTAADTAKENEDSVFAINRSTAVVKTDVGSPPVTTSTVSCYANGYGELFPASVDVTMTSVTAPTFRAGSDVIYQAQMKKLFHQILQDQAERGVQIVILPELSKSSDAQAINLYNRALKEVLAESKYSPPIQEIIRALPDKDSAHKNDRYKGACDNFAGFNGRPIVTIANVDAIEAAHFANQARKTVGIINPISDKGIGWSLFAGITDVEFVQSPDYNPERISYPRPASHPVAAVAASTKGSDHKHRMPPAHAPTPPSTLPRLFYLSGRLRAGQEAKQYREFLEKSGTDPARSVFIFPSNIADHHTPTTTLYSRKGGANLGVPAEVFSGDEKWPVLGLPTDKHEKVDASVRKAVADIWKAIGFGLNVVLPVRPHTAASRYFKDDLKGSPGNEPSFWGGVVPNGNPVLAEYYLEQLAVMDDFLRDPDPRRLLGMDPEFKLAYEKGQQQRTNPDDPWFISSQAKREENREDVADREKESPASAPVSTIVDRGSIAKSTPPSRVDFTTPESQRQIAPFLKKYCPSDTWSVKKPASSEANAPVTFSSGESEFSVYPNKIETQKPDQKSFFTILVAFRALHPAGEQLPCIATYPEAKSVWMAAIDQAAAQNVYPPEQIKSIRDRCTAPNGPPAPAAPATAMPDSSAAVATRDAKDVKGEPPPSPRP